MDLRTLYLQFLSLGVYEKTINPCSQMILRCLPLDTDFIVNPLDSHNFIHSLTCLFMINPFVDISLSRFSFDVYKYFSEGCSG